MAQVTEDIVGNIQTKLVPAQRRQLYRLFEKIAVSYSDDPGTSDLYDEQPVTLSIDLGDVRLIRQILR